MSMPIHNFPWYKTRGYAHFDLPIGVKQAESIVTSPDRVKRHSFYPFIAYEIKSKKVRKGDDGQSLSIKEKSRPVSYASHVDSHIYTYYAHLLSESYESILKKIGIEQNVLAFRKLGKNNIEFANEAFNEIIKRKDCAAIAFDIEGFFDNLNHSILKGSWCRILGTEKLPEDHYRVFRSLTKFSKVDKDRLYQAFGISKNNLPRSNQRICEPKQFRKTVRSNGMINVNNTSKGIPQGSPISALLSNIYMTQFDEIISNLMTQIDGSYFRYCDDILCIIPIAKKAEIIEIISREIRKLKLNINQDKTKSSEYRIIHGQLTCDKPLQYLGFIFDGHHKLIRSAALARFSERMKSGVRLAKLTKNKYNKIRRNNSQPKQALYKRKIYDRYSHLGRRNFIRYGLRSAEIMESGAIKKQLKPLWTRLQNEIEK